MFLLFGVIGSLQIYISLAQLRNLTLTKQDLDKLDNSDYYDSRSYNVNGNRIMGGKPVNIRQVPWQVVLFRDDAFVCGGSIISVDWVLTAAHCIKSGSTYTIRAGSPYKFQGGQLRRASVVVMSASYIADTAHHDIAMIRVRTRFKFSQFVKPVALARNGRSLPQYLFVSGWGNLADERPSPYHLRAVTIPKVNRSKCRRIYDNITKYKICAGGYGKNTCFGDSGGALVRRRIQYGIVSYGDRCGDNPGVYTNIRRVNKWIRNVVRRRGGKQPKFK